MINSYKYNVKQRISLCYCGLSSHISDARADSCDAAIDFLLKKYKSIYPEEAFKELLYYKSIVDYFPLMDNVKNEFFESILYQTVKCLFNLDSKEIYLLDKYEKEPGIPLPSNFIIIYFHRYVETPNPNSFPSPKKHKTSIQEYKNREIQVSGKRNLSL